MNASEGYFMRDWNIVYMSYCDGEEGSTPPHA